jgi:uroporphyrinogen-III synthase
MTALDKIAQALRQAGAAGISVEGIERLLYADRDDPEGGPDARNCIRVMMHNLRKRGVPVERVTVYRVKPRR